MPTEEEFKAAYLALPPMVEDKAFIVRLALEAAERVRNGVIQSVKHDDHHDWTHPLIREDRPE